MGGTSGEAGGGMGGEGGEGPDPRTPIVTIVSPEALADPADGPVLVGTEVDVVCRAEQSSESGSEEVNPESVRIEMLDEEGDRVGESRQGVPNGNDDEYATTFPISGLPNGVVTFRCTAEDVSSPALIGEGSSSTFVDHGPAIFVVSPVEGDVYPQMGLARFEIQVDPDPLTDDDPEAEVDADSVTLRVADVAIPLDEEDPGVFVANVDFTDEFVFERMLEGEVSLYASAANRRSDPGPVTRETGYFFIVDGQGPTITITSPANDRVVGGSVKLVFSVSDDYAGVEPSSVVVSVNDEDHRYVDGSTAWRRAGDTYEFTFNSLLIQGSEAQATIRISAEDTKQNPARVATLTLYLDNVPPIVDLDPPTLQEKNADGFCSAPFDPIGISADDLEIVPEGLPRPRAFIWEQTNIADNITPHYSGVNDATVYLYLQPDTTQPLIEDGEDSDSICDRINPAVMRKVQLTAVPPAGAALFGTGTDDVPLGCKYNPSDPPDDTLCANQTSELTRVMSFDIDDQVPVIYAHGSLSEPDCTGTGWEIQQFAQEGWICLAAVAVDNVGNRAVSRPLRLCFDDLDTTARPSCVNGQNPPSCVRDNCTLPKSFSATLVEID